MTPQETVVLSKMLSEYVVSKGDIDETKFFEWDKYKEVLPFAKKSCGTDFNLIVKAAFADKESVKAIVNAGKAKVVFASKEKDEKAFNDVIVHEITSGNDVIVKQCLETGFPFGKKIAFHAAAEALVGEKTNKDGVALARKAVIAFDDIAFFDFLSTYKIKTKNRKLFSELYKNNADFKSFAKICLKYGKDQDNTKAELDTVGSRIVDALGKAEATLVKSVEGGKDTKFFAVGLADKFQEYANRFFPFLKDVGVRLIKKANT